MTGPFETWWRKVQTRQEKEDQEFLEFFNVSSFEEYWERLELHALIETLKMLHLDIQRAVYLAEQKLHEDTYVDPFGSC